MKPQILTLGALVLVSLLTWLGMKGASTGASVSDSALRVLDEYSAAESALYRDVLSARVGTLRNYDAITQGAERLDRVVADLRTIALSDPQLLPEVEKLANRVDQQVRWSERFTTSNALLQNSLAYFDIAGRRLTDEGPGPLAQEVGALAAAVLHLTMDSSPAAVADVDVRLTSMNPHEYKDFTVVESLRSHAKLLQTVLPQTEGTVKSLFVVAAGSEPSELRSMVLARRRDAERRTTVFRYGLLAASLVLAGALLLLGNSLRRHSEALRRRAAIEHILARISMRFISSKPGDLTEHIQRALAELATCCGASRAYFLTPEAASEEPYRWITPGAAFPHNWFSRVTAVARRMRSGTNDVIHVIDTERLPYGLNRECLISGGARAWLCATSTVKGQEAILAFDFADANPRLRMCDPAVLSMAFDAIANVIERDSLERDRVRLETHLQQARRLETVGAFASGIAHNFNNIIGAIVGFAEGAQVYSRRSSQISRNLAEIRTAGERARDLVGQILAFGRRGSLLREPMCLSALLTETRPLLRAALPSAVDISVREPARPVIVGGHAAQLQQVILNLCTNAAQSMNGAGVVEVVLDLQEVSRQRRLEHGALVAGNYAVLTVIDRGRGIDEAIRARIFEPFFTTREDGNGLGLATVREIVLDHGGALAVYSAASAGTRIEVWLPQTESSGVAEPCGVAKPVPRGQGQSILVLDPDRERLLRQEDVIAALGYEPVGFQSPDHAAEAITQSPSRFDAALFCFREQAVSSVLRFIAPLRSRVPHVPIILSMSSSQLGDTPALAQAGISAIVGQPVTASELATTLSQHLRVPLHV